MLPPEVTSALIHSGPGAGSLIAASGMWHELGTELEDALRGYASVLSALTEAWRGPSAMTMAQAVQPYLAWLDATAQQCQLIGFSVQTVVAAFELTHFTVVHPSLVAANRALLAQLLATNFFGVNLPAIAATEAEYQAMWVNNSAAMYSYEATSASAVVPTQFASPPPITDPTGVAAQTSAVSTATTASPTATAFQSTALTFAPVLTQTATPFDPNQGWFGLANTWGNQFIAGGFPVSLLSYLAQLTSAQALTGVNADVGASLAEGAALGAGEGALGGIGAAGLGLGEAPAAALGVGVSVGGLTAPPAVVGLLPASQAPIQLASAASPLPAAEPRLPMLPPLMPPPLSKGGRQRDGRDYEDVEYGWELPGTVMQRPPSAG